VSQIPTHFKVFSLLCPPETTEKPAFRPLICRVEKHP